MKAKSVEIDEKSNENKKVEVTIETNQEGEIEMKIEKPKETALQDLPGIGPATIEKLEVVGYTDLMSIAVATPGELVGATGMSDAAAKKLIAMARTSLDMGFESGEDLLIKRHQIKKISLHCKSFDDMLGGGFETSSVVEVFGAYGSSKTQIAHQLSVNIQKDDPTAVAVYIDTESTFRPERIIQMSEAAGLIPEAVLKNIKVAKAFNSDHQMLLAEKVDDLIKKQGLNVRLLVVDSLTAHFRAEFIGRGTLAERQQKINKHMRVLAKIAHINNLCVLVTNQVMSRPDQFFGDPTEAIGGHIVGHNSTFRIYLRRGKKGTRVAKLIDSPNLPETESVFNITEGGIASV